MENSKIANNLVSIILKATDQDEHKLKSTREMLVKIVDTIGAKRFVTIAAGILKDNFRIEGCNDARISLKRIFDISLDELIGWLEKKDYHLPKGHPIILLSQDHRDNVNRLNALATTLESLNRNATYGEDVWHRILSGISEYYYELDSHIRKEEEVLFPVLEKNGMKEHPDISNHIFRETYIFYPATLEFITDLNEWKGIKREFEIKR